MLFLLKGAEEFTDPIRVLFGTDRNRLCWYISSYKSQVAPVAELIRIPPEVIC